MSQNYTTHLGNISGGLSKDWHDDWPEPRTDAQGHYELRGIGPGQWQLHASLSPRFEGDYSYETIRLTPGQTVRKDLRVTERTDWTDILRRLAAAKAGTTSLADAVRAINQQAAKLPECRTQKPLTEDQIVKSIEQLARDDRLSDAEYQELKRIAETCRLPKNVVLHQFVRYNDGTDVQHGWWVRLLLLRDDKSPLVGYGTFSLAIREEPAFRRPYTQKERLFWNEVRRTHGIPLLNRLVAYFDEDPKFDVPQRFAPQEADRLADAVKKAIKDSKVDDLLKTYYWEGVDKDTRAAVRAEAEKFASRRLSFVSVSPRRFGGRLHHWQGFKTWDPNLPVLGYIVVKFGDTAGPRSVWLEFGESQGGTRLVNYIVSQDDGPRLVGKPLPGRVGMRGIPLVEVGDGWFESYLQIEAPDELPALKNANFESLEGPAHTVGRSTASEMTDAGECSVGQTFLSALLANFAVGRQGCLAHCGENCSRIGRRETSDVSARLPTTWVITSHSVRLPQPDVRGVRTTPLTQSGQEARLGETSETASAAFWLCVCVGDDESLKLQVCFTKESIRCRSAFPSGTGTSATRPRPWFRKSWKNSPASTTASVPLSSPSTWSTETSPRST